jgi:NADH-quinone oxidoreductase subunit C
VAVVPKDDAAIDSLVPLFAGAEWHEREARDMFGIDFPGNPNLVNIYLPDEFVGNPLLKSFPLLSRDVKPWPGQVDVEGMPGDDDEEDAEA